MSAARATRGTNGQREPGIGICVADPALRLRLRRALEGSDPPVVAVEATLAALLDRSPRAALACVIVAAPRPGPASASAVARVRAALGAVRVVLVCEAARPADARRAIARGADGVVLADRVETSLAAAVADVIGGQLSIPRSLRRQVDPGAALTAREREILALVVAGLTNAQIAARIYLAESTVKSHLTSAFAKLGVSSRYEATRLLLDPEAGRELGIVPPRPAPGVDGPDDRGRKKPDRGLVARAWPSRERMTVPRAVSPRRSRR
jgi:DNA-binding NarL/FixJ family response regulator